MAARFHVLFGDARPAIGALPGRPPYDASDGLDGLLRAARADLDALQGAGVEAIMFGNENDRPYQFSVGIASTATMAHVIGRLCEYITVPFGVNVLWDPTSTLALAAATRRVIYGARPEHLELASSGIPARVAVVEPTGSDTLAYLRFGGRDIVAVFPDQQDLSPGQDVWLRPRPDRVHLFDPGSGLRL